MRTNFLTISLFLAFLVSAYSAHAERAFTSGFETNDLTKTEWTSTSSTAPAIITSPVHSGSFALSAANSATRYARRDTPSSIVSGTLFARAYFRMENIISPANSYNPILELRSSGSTKGAGVEFNGFTRRFLLRNSVTGANSTGTIIASTGIWYRIELRTLLSDTTGEIELRIFDSENLVPLETLQLGGDTLPSNYRRMLVGNIEGRNLGSTVFFDDTALNNISGSFQNSWAGPGRINLLRPDSDISAQWMRAGTSPAGANFGSVDDLPPNDGADFNEDNYTAKIDRLGITDLSPAVSPNSTIRLLDAYARIGSTNTSTRRIDLILWDESGVQTRKYNISVAVKGWKILSTAEHLVYDAAGKTVADVDSFSAGYQGSSGLNSSKRVSALWINAEWIESPDSVPPSVSVSHSPSEITSATNVTINASAADNIQVANVKIFADDVLVKTCSSSPCSYSFLPSFGAHSYYATATDMAGNTAHDPPAGTKLLFAGSYCGNSIAEGSEVCDDGNASNNDACKNDCTLNICGDGFVGPGEQCDDGNIINNDTCTNTCELPECGDAIQQSGEQCDDGNTVSEDGCSAQCIAEVCGDGIQQEGLGEQCDSSNLAGQTCQTQGFTCGALACMAACTFDATGCYNADLQSDINNCGVCGFVCSTATCQAGVCVDTTPPDVAVSHSPATNITASTPVNITATATDNVIVSSIGIFVDDLLKKTCIASPCTYLSTYPAGVHTYYSTASDAQSNLGRDPAVGTKSFSVQAFCGNSIIEGTEQCDTGNLAGQTCQSSGFTCGPLACSLSCSFSTAACYNANLSSDNSNCGLCGNVCATGFTCSAGACTDLTAPNISSVAATNISSNSAKIIWATNEPADSQVVYGLNTSYGNTTALNTSLVTAHSQLLSGLQPNKTYHYSAKSKDAAGNLAVSDDFTFTTLAQASLIPSALGWYPVPNTKIRSVCPPDTSSYDYTFYCGGVVEAWSGAIADTSRNRMIVWGGGHGGYRGNEVYELDLVGLKIKRLNDPSPNSDLYINNPAADDGKANARHTYNGLAYIEHLDKMYIFGGAIWRGGQTASDTWLLNLSTLQWEFVSGAGAGPTDHYNSHAHYDPVTKKVLLADRKDLWRFDPEAKTYSRIGSFSIDLATSSVLDPKRRILFAFGMTWGGSPQFAAINVDTGQAVSMSLSGCSGLTTAVSPGNREGSGPGLAYDPVQDRIVGWVTGNTVYIFNPDTSSCTTQTFTGGPGTPTTQGTYGRFRYFPSIGVFAVVNSVDQDAYTLRLTPA